MNLIFKPALLYILIVLFSSCATIVSGARQKVEIASEPGEAKVYINEIEIGNTPVEQNLKRNQEYQLAIKLDGYETYEMKLERKFNAWYIGNVLFGGIIGLVVDPATGAMHRLRPQDLEKHRARGTIFKNKSENIYIKVQMQNDINTEKIGQMQKISTKK
ncbi:PEGA domain-containing protein [Aquimarina sp. U1-2]|nr:PEGA domain-containing protein [Aquimarina sp. U1-2]